MLVLEHLDTGAAEFVTSVITIVECEKNGARGL